MTLSDLEKQDAKGQAILEDLDNYALKLLGWRFGVAVTRWS